jgi:hypothetical protein
VTSLIAEPAGNAGKIDASREESGHNGLWQSRSQINGMIDPSDRMPRRDKSRFVLAGGAIADYCSTIGMRGNEQNPLMGRNRAQQAAVMGTSIGLAFLFHRILKDAGHQKAARAYNDIIGAVHFGAAAWNLSQRYR